MVQYTKQDVRNAIPQRLDLENYDAAAMLADLGPQRLKDLPLKGRVVYQTETPFPKRPGINSEVIAKWSQYVEKEAEELAKKGVDDIEEDGLGLGGSYRKGPNYRPMPVCIGLRMGPRLSGPARFRAGARGPNSGARRRSPSPPSMRDGFLGPKPKNPTFEARPFRGQLVTRHVNTKAIAGFGEARSSAASATSHHHSIQPKSTVTTGITDMNLKKTTLATATTNPNPNLSQLVSDISNAAQAASKLANVTAGIMPSTPKFQSSAPSPDLSRPASRASSTFGPPVGGLQDRPRWLKSTAVPIRHPRSRDTIRPVQEASKNHWNLAPLVLQAANGVTKHEAKSSPLTTSVITDVAKPQLASISLQVPSVAEEKPELEPARQAADSTRVANWAALENPSASMGLINTPSGQKLDAPSGTQPVTKQNAIPDLPCSKIADPAPSGLSTSKYADLAPSTSKYATPQVPGLSASKYAHPVSTGLSASKYATPQEPGLSASKYATAAAPGLSASRYATSAAPGLSASRYATSAAPGLSASSTPNTVYGASGLYGSKYSGVAPPRPTSSDALSGLASSKYAPESKEMKKPQNTATQIETPAVPAMTEVMEVKEVIREIVDTNEMRQDEPAIKTEEGAITLESDVAVQVPMPASQRLLDSIAARYKFASPKQVSGLARRYGTIIVANKDSPMKSISPQEREIDDATRAFQALFISRGRRVFRQPQLPVSHNMASCASRG